MYHLTSGLTAIIYQFPHMLFTLLFMVISWYLHGIYMVMTYYLHGIYMVFASGFLDWFHQHLSGGQRMRVAMAVALYRRPGNTSALYCSVLYSTCL